jgi:hypothetical protein
MLSYGTITKTHRYLCIHLRGDATSRKYSVSTSRYQTDGGRDRAWTESEFGGLEIPAVAFQKFDAVEESGR